MLAVGALGESWVNKSKPILLSFSTVGCPDWTFDQIIHFAKVHGYNGIELRGILRELDLVKCPEFNSPAAIALSRKKVEDKGLQIVCLGSSAVLHEPRGLKRLKNIDEAKRFIDLANGLNCHAIRVFPDKTTTGNSREKTLENMTESLLDIAAYAKGSPVQVLVETHGELLQSEEILALMQSVSGTQTGLVWDFVNMWTKTNVPPSEIYQKLKPYIKHTHIKNLIRIDGKDRDTLLEQGIAPIFEVIQILQQNDYQGFYSFEWEKLWQPEIEEPEIALADYALLMRKKY